MHPDFRNPISGAGGGREGNGELWALKSTLREARRFRFRVVDEGFGVRGYLVFKLGLLDLRWTARLGKPRLA